MVQIVEVNSGSHTIPGHIHENTESVNSVITGIYKNYFTDSFVIENYKTKINLRYKCAYNYVKVGILVFYIKIKCM